MSSWIARGVKHIIPAIALGASIWHMWVGLTAQLNVDVLWIALLYFGIAEGGTLLSKIIESKWPPRS